MFDFLLLSSPGDEGEFNGLTTFEQFVQSTSLKVRSGPIVKWGVEATTPSSTFNWIITNWEVGTIKLQLPSQLLSLLAASSYSTKTSSAENWSEETVVTGEQVGDGLTIFMAPRSALRLRCDWTAYRESMSAEMRQAVLKALPLFITCTLTKEANLREKLRMKQLLNRHLFFYTNIIEYQVVGSARLPLLRVVDSKNLEHQSAFFNPYYIPLSVNHLDEIGCFLYNSRGIPTDFNPGGRTVAVFHFRRRD